MAMLKSSTRLALALASTLALANCATIDSTADAPSVTQNDRATAARSHPQILQQFGGAIEGPLATYVSGVGERVESAKAPKSGRISELSAASAGQRRRRRRPALRSPAKEGEVALPTRKANG